jgi:hypothetical protein
LRAFLDTVMNFRVPYKQGIFDRLSDYKRLTEDLDLFRYVDKNAVIHPISHFIRLSLCNFYGESLVKW